MSRTALCVSVFAIVFCLTRPAVVQDAPPPRANAALAYWQAFALMPAIDNDLRKKLGQCVSGEHPVDKQLQDLVNSSANALQYMHRGTKVDACDWGIAYDLGPYAMLPHLSKSRDLARIALLRARLSFNAGENQAAMDDIIATVRLGRHSAQEGVIILISILVNYGIEAQIVDTTAEFLPKMKKAEIQSLRNRLRDIPKPSSMSEAILGERELFLTWLIDAAGKESAQQKLVELAGSVDDGLKKKVSAASAQQLVRWARDLNDVYEAGSRLMKLSPDEALAAEKKLLAPLQAPESANPLGMMFLPSFGSARRAEAHYLTRQALLQAAFDVQLSGSSALSRPENRDPFGDGPFRYQKTDSGFELVSDYVHQKSPVTLRIGAASK